MLLFLLFFQFLTFVLQRQKNYWLYVLLDFLRIALKTQQPIVELIKIISFVYKQNFQPTWIGTCSKNKYSLQQQLFKVVLFFSVSLIKYSNVELIRLHSRQRSNQMIYFYMILNRIKTWIYRNSPMDSIFLFFAFFVAPTIYSFFMHKFHSLGCIPFSICQYLFSWPFVNIRKCAMQLKVLNREMRFIIMIMVMKNIRQIQCTKVYDLRCSAFIYYNFLYSSWIWFSLHQTQIFNQVF